MMSHPNELEGALPVFRMFSSMDITTAATLGSHTMGRFRANACSKCSMLINIQANYNWYTQNSLFRNIVRKSPLKFHFKISNSCVSVAAMQLSLSLSLLVSLSLSSLVAFPV